MSAARPLVSQLILIIVRVTVAVVHHVFMVKGVFSVPRTFVFILLPLPLILPVEMSSIIMILVTSMRIVGEFTYHDFESSLPDMTTSCIGVIAFQIRISNARRRQCRGDSKSLYVNSPTVCTLITSIIIIRAQTFSTLHK